MRKFLFAAVGVAALAGAGLALAQDQHRGPFRGDANNDGVLTRQEFDSAHARHFDDADSNDDGALAHDEHRGRHRGGERRGRGGHHGRGMHHADANNDGDITRAEFLAGPTEMFERLDANHDGVIQASERPQRRERGGDDGPSHHTRFNPDADNNGTISREEFAAQGGQMFERMDANSDGRVTRDEAEAMHGRHHERTPAQAQ